MRIHTDMVERMGKMRMTTKAEVCWNLDSDRLVESLMAD